MTAPVAMIFLACSGDVHRNSSWIPLLLFCCGNGEVDVIGNMDNLVRNWSEERHHQHANST